MAKEWSDPSPGEKAGIVASAVVQFALLAAEVRGRKAVWVAVSLVSYVGPVSYFLFRRK